MFFIQFVERNQTRKDTRKIVAGVAAVIGTAAAVHPSTRIIGATIRALAKLSDILD